MVHPDARQRVRRHLQINDVLLVALGPGLVVRDARKLCRGAFPEREPCVGVEALHVAGLQLSALRHRRERKQGLGGEYSDIARSAAARS